MATRPGYIWSGTEWVSIGQEAVVAPVAYQTSAPSSPSTGDIWIDSDDDVPSVNSTLYYRWKKTMSGGETSVSGTDDNSLTLAYTAGYESVFINGVLQVRGSDYTATTGTSVTGMTALTAGDIVMVESVVAYSVGDTYTQSQMTSLLSGKSDVSTTGLVLVATASIGTAVPGVQINNCFSSTYDNYRIIISGFVPSASGNNLPYRMSSAGTPVSTSTYTSQRLYAQGSTVGAAVTANASSGYLGAMAVTTNFYVVDVMNPFLSTVTKFISNAAYGDSSTDAKIDLFTSLHQTASSYDGVYIFPASGTITGGTIKVYGYK